MHIKPNERSTPVPGPEHTMIDQENQSAEKLESSNNGVIAIIVIAGIIILGLLFFSGWWT